jgi:hypothetical protein
VQNRHNDPSVVVWDWRKADDAGARAREAAAARKRGALGLVIGLAAAALLYLWKPKLALVVAAVALILGLLALVAPLTLYKKVTHAFDVFAHGVAAAVTWVLMTLLYYLLFLPAGLILRARRKLAITRSFDPGLSTYWTATDGRQHPPESYRKQF